MAYSLISVSNLAELKTRRGNPANTTMASIMGLNYPLIDAWSIYAWDEDSTATPDDIRIVQPTIGGIPYGRWVKVDLDQMPQVNSDWNSTGGVSMILNKPVLFDGNYNSLSNKPSLFSGSYTDLTNKPSLFSGSYNDLSSKPTIPAAQVSCDWNATSGNNQILNKPAIPTLNRVERYSGTTSGSGTYTVTYPVAFSTTPHVDPVMLGAAPTNTIRVTSSSTTGFTITANNTVNVLGLLPSYPTLNGLTIDVIVTEK